MTTNQFYIISLLTALFLSPASFAQSLQQAGHECSGEATNPEYQCDVAGGQEDLRFSIIESQSCEKGKITSTTVLASGDLYPYNPESNFVPVVTVEFSHKRVHLDDRVNDVTMQLPKSSVIQTEYVRFEIQMTEEIIPDFEGADVASQWAYLANYKKFNSKGVHVGSGKMHCRIID